MLANNPLYRRHHWNFQVSYTLPVRTIQCCVNIWKEVAWIVTVRRRTATRFSTQMIFFSSMLPLFPYLHYNWLIMLVRELIAQYENSPSDNEYPLELCNFLTLMTPAKQFSDHWERCNAYMSCYTNSICTFCMPYTV